MKSSIRVKLFSGICALILFFVSIAWIVNFYFLERFYIKQKSAVLEQQYRYIDALYRGDLGTLTRQLERIVHANGLNIVILDRNLRIKSTYSPRPPGLPPPPESRRLPPSFIPHTDWSKPQVFVDLKKGPTGYLNFTATLQQGDYLWLGMPIGEIKQSVAISNQFFLMTGALTLLIGGALALGYSKRFTRPILELNEIAQNMVRLDFTRMYPVQTRDEIGELGLSINSLCEQLGKSISELQQANSKLALENERQKRVDENRKEFISNVSHELKTPLALIQGYAEGLQVNVNESEEDKNFYCNVIMAETAKMNKLVRELLDLSEIDSGYLRLEKEQFDLADLTEQVLEKYQLILKEKGINLAVEKTGATFVCADLSRIEQVLVNYLNNAIGHVDGAKRIRVKIEAAQENVRLAVFNTGQPIPAEALAKIWFSFYKVDQARTRSLGGTGLGLAIVRAILECHQGEFGVANVADGVEFWFTLAQAADSRSVEGGLDNTRETIID